MNGRWINPSIHSLHVIKIKQINSHYNFTLINPSIHSAIHPFAHLFIYPFIYLLTYSFIDELIDPFIYLLNHSFNPHLDSFRCCTYVVLALEEPGKSLVRLVFAPAVRVCLKFASQNQQLVSATNHTHEMKGIRTRNGGDDDT